MKLIHPSIDPRDPWYTESPALRIEIDETEEYQRMRLTEIREQGRQAFLSGQPESVNPYTKRSDRMEWADGWDDEWVKASEVDDTQVFLETELAAIAEESRKACAA